MSEEYLVKLCKLLYSYSGRVEDIRKLFRASNSISGDQAEIASLYLMLSTNEKSVAEMIVKSLPGANPDQKLSQISLVPKTTTKSRAHRHPPVKSWPNGEFLADSIHSFAVHHDPPLKYEGMHTALDVLTACFSPEGEPYDFHYEIKAYKADGVYIQRVPRKGHRTSADDTHGITD